MALASTTINSINCIMRWFPPNTVPAQSIGFQQFFKSFFSINSTHHSLSTFSLVGGQNKYLLLQKREAY